MAAKIARAKPMVFLITAGPTIEDIDPVRFISNRATGKLGVEMARAALNAKRHTILIHGPLSETAQGRMPKDGTLFSDIAVRSAAQMHAAVVENFCVADVIIMNAAVTDFTPISISESKLKKKTSGLVMRLKPTVDILAELGAAKTNPWRAGQSIIGFALESGSGKTAAQRRKSAHAEAVRKLNEKNLDAIVLDSPAEMGSDKGSFNVILRDGRVQSFKDISKEAFAEKLIQLATELQSTKS